MCNYCLLLRDCVLCTDCPVPHRASVLPLCLEYSYIIAANTRKGGRELVLPAALGHISLCENQFCIYDLHSSVSDAVHLSDPFHLVAGVQRFRNALCICHLFYQPNPQKQGAGILCCIFCWIGRLCFLEL